MARNHWLFAAMGVAAVLACTPVAAQQTAAADAFVDSVGVNVHLHYTDTPYFDRFSTLRDRLIDLGVRHVRDGVVDQALQQYYERFASLAEAGIKGTFITAPNQSTEVWASFPARVGDAVEAFEGPNEYDQSRDPNWAQTLTETLKRLRSLKSDPRTSAYPIYGPSLTSETAYTALGDVSAYFDYANMHNYFAGRHPGTAGWGANGYGSIGWNLDLNRRYAQEKAIVTTETGYQDTASEDGAVPQRVAGLYMPRLLLEQFRAGVVRTFLYELCDWSKTSGGWGLLDLNASPKPAFLAVKNLLSVLRDPGPPFAVEDLRYSVEGATGDLHHMAFQKRNGTYLLALWLDVPSWDPAAQRPVGTEVRHAVIRLPDAMRVVRTHRWQPDGTVSMSGSSTRSASVPMIVSDALTIIELTR